MTLIIVNRQSTTRGTNRPMVRHFHFLISSFVNRHSSSFVNRHSYFVIPLVFLSWSAIALAQLTSYTIYGIVRLPSGEVAQRVTIHVKSQTGFDRQVFTDDMGRYEIRDLPRGRYFLTAVNPAAPDQFTDPVEADTGRSYSGRVLVHIYLRLRATTEPVIDKTSPVISVIEATQEIPKGARKAFEQAIRQRSEMKTASAAESFDKAIEIYPGYFQALAERGHLRIMTGKFDDAASDFAKALELNPRYGPALRGSGMCKLEQGKFHEAVTDLEASLALEPNLSVSYLFLGVAHLALEQREPARAALEKALSLDPEGSVRAHVHLANIYLKEQRLEEALREIQIYLEAEPNAPDAKKLRSVEAQIQAQLSRPQLE